MKTITTYFCPVSRAIVLLCFAFSPIARAADGNLGNANTAEGGKALSRVTTGLDNTAIGFHTLFLTTTGAANTATGQSALAANMAGSRNTATGNAALFSNVASDNTATGHQALFTNTTGSHNTATGTDSLFRNETGSDSTAVGDSALAFNNADNNTAIGYQALTQNATGSNNMANGYQALAMNSDGHDNTASGFNALLKNRSGFGNTATGASALQSNTNIDGISGNNNTAIGEGALLNNTTGSSNIAVGGAAGGNLTTGSDNIDIGNAGVGGESGTIRIGTQAIPDGGAGQTATYIAGIYGQISASGVPVYVDSSGQLGTTTSSARFKRDVKPMDNGSEPVLQLRPVMFHYKTDSNNTPQFGLVAEEVAKINPDLVVRDAKGEIYTVRYDAVNAMLLNEFIKEHRKVLEQQKQIDKLTVQLKEQASMLHKVSAQIELMKERAAHRGRHEIISRRPIARRIDLTNR